MSRLNGIPSAFFFVLSLLIFNCLFISRSIAFLFCFMGFGTGLTFGLAAILLRALSILLHRAILVSFLSNGIFIALQISSSSGLECWKHNFLPIRKFLFAVVPVTGTFLPFLAFLNVTDFVVLMFLSFLQISSRVPNLPTTPIFLAKSMSWGLGIRTHFLLFMFSAATCVVLRMALALGLALTTGLALGLGLVRVFLSLSEKTPVTVISPMAYIFSISF